MGRLKLDLHPIARNGTAIESELHRVIDEAESKRLRTVEIVHGKGSGQLKKRVLKFLQRADIKARYARVEKDPKNAGHLLVHFRL
jgi:dsDNA-specific endonuclease/ATPase MutS2